MSIIGESIDGEVDKQISIRQNLHGKQTRTNTDLSILNNTNAWLKLASSVRVISQTDTEITSSLTTGNKVESTPTYNPATGEYEEVEENISTGERRLRDIGLDNTGKFTGNQLAKKAVLFNTLSEVNSSVGASIASGSRTSTTDGTYNSRSGVSSTTDLWNNNSYGLGGTDFGLVPAPGLISAKIDCKNRGSIREATVELKAYNLFQFELIELLYLRLGYSMLLEWGWNKYLNRNGALTPMGNTLTEDLWFQDLPTSNYRSVIKSIADYRKIYDNNYDGFLGKVVNFDWSFQPDGTYNITLKLITIGDVIESLKVNLPSQLTTAAEVSDAINSGNDASTILLAGESPIVTNAGSSTLSLDLYNDIASSKPDKWEVMGGNYFSLLLNLQRDNFNVASFNPKKDSKAQFPPSGVDSNKYTYFLTFRTLLDKLNTLCIPSINDGKLLEFDTSGENICSAFPNQVSFNPKICLIKPQYTETINLSKHPEDFVNKLTGVKNNWNALARLKDFFTIEKGTNVLYGNIMDIYLNYDFISNTLQKNTGKGGEISIYKFLEDVCDNINSSLGGINKLEPILEDDNIVKIIDQNPIPGIETSETFKDRFGQTTPFEIYGFSPSGSTSNFVRDFGFKTKIGPELASMITIGAAAQNKSTKNYDGTAFSKWNDGLQDAYAITYDDPKDADLNVTGSNESYPLTKEQLVKMMNKFIKSPEDEYWGIFPRRTKTTKIHGIEITGTKDVEDDPITKRNYSNVTWVMYVRLVKQQVLLELINNSKTTKPEPPDPLSNYLGWLIQAFAGNINGTYNDSSFYFYFNDDFYKIGKELFKGFINGINNEVYSKSRTPSNTIGFIPADLSLTIDGLSGIKIYNALSINQRFLPKQYPLALNFIITKVNHDISSNNWSTSLHSIAVPKTAAFDPSFLSISVSNVISSQQSTLEAFTGPTPNADILRAYLNTIPDYSEKGSEISNGGDITLEAANMAVSVFKEINNQYRGLGIIVTGGNDAYHQNLNSNSIHKVGNGIDFTIHKVTNDNLSAINKILKGFAASNSPNFRYIDEYSKASTNANGAHFHMSYEVGTEAQSALPPSTTTTTSSSEKSTFTYFPEYAKISDIKSGNSFAYTITVTINYDDGKNIGTGVGKSVIVFDNEYAAKASATLKAKQDLTNQFNN
jgi:hypothetical protein